MNSRTRHFLIGLGSILDIMPSRPRRTRPRRMPMTPEQIQRHADAGHPLVHVASGMRVDLDGETP